MDQLFQELASLNSSGPMTVTVTATATAGLSSQTNAPNSSSFSSSSSSNIGAAVGAGIGVPLGILAVGILGFLFYRERRHSPFNGQPTESRSNIMEMEPPKTYHKPPPPPPQSYQQQPPVSRPQFDDQKSPAYINGPSSDVHEMI